jgi:SAM-dependent methyltransferase
MLSYTYRHARERALIELLNNSELSLDSASILDIGCGSGGFVNFAVSLGAYPNNVYGVDLIPSRVAKARRVCPPESHLQVGDGRYIAFASETFDIIGQFTVFSSILSDDYRQGVAQEIDRTLKTGGSLIWYDMVKRFPDDSDIQGINQDELQRLFPELRIVQCLMLHNRLFRRMAPRSWRLAQLVDVIPGMGHSHILALMSKT